MQTHRFAAVALVAVASQGCNDLTVRAISQGRGTPMAGIQAQIDDGKWVETDGSGQVTLSRPGGPFILRVHQVITSPDPSMYRLDRIWSFRDPEDRELVVPVESTWLPRYHMVIDGQIEGGSGGALGASFTGDPNAFAWMSGTGFHIDAETERPAPFTALVRALEWVPVAPELPGSFVQYGEAEVSLADSGAGRGAGSVTVKLQPVTEGMVTGSVTGALDQAQVEAFLAFPTGGVFASARLLTGPSTFVLPLPEISGPQAWVIATAGGGGLAERWHKRRVPVPSTDVALDLPDPVEPVDPALDVPAGAGTVFRWSGGPDGGRVTLDLICEWIDPDGRVRALHSVVETSGTEQPMPTFEDATIVAPGSCRWTLGWTSAGHLVSRMTDPTPDDYRRSLTEMSWNQYE